MRPNELKALDEKYRYLTFALNDGGDGDFISGWQCHNPFADDLALAVRERSASLSAARYSYYGTQADLAEALKQLHVQRDGVAPISIQCGPGATSLMYCWIRYLQSQGIKKVYYIPPLYLTAHNAIQSCGMRAVPVSTRHAYDPEFSLRLPKGERAVLFLTDPIWYAGCPVPNEVISEIKEWQSQTGSTVFVDGSMQYMQWGDESAEFTAALDPSLTTRLVCPAKQLCMNGIRFAYLLGPDAQREAMAWLQSNILGSASVESIAFAYETLDSKLVDNIKSSLMSTASHNYQLLKKLGAITEVTQPSCTYYTYAGINIELPRETVLLDGSFYGLRDEKKSYKINLLSPSLSKIFLTDELKEVA